MYTTERNCRYLSGCPAVRPAIGSGGVSWLPSISSTTSATSARMPPNAASWVCPSQLSYGNSAHSPTYSPFSADHVPRYV